MDFKIEPYFTLVVVGMALVFFYNRLILRKKRVAAFIANAGGEASKAEGEESKDLTLLDKHAIPDPWLIEQVNAIFPVLFFVWVFRSFFLEPFQIPSSSMEPTLNIGDFILVSKFAYGVRSPISHERLIDVGLPERGDVAVFIPPIDDRYYIKRVIGMPGDSIRYQNQRLYINDQLVEINITREDRALTYFDETLGEMSHKTKVNRVFAESPSSDVVQGEGQWQVPEGYYFVMGDNRGNSYDSRLWRDPETGQAMSFVPESQFIGKAFAVWLHWNEWNSIPSFSFNRMIQ